MDANRLDKGFGLGFAPDVILGNPGMKYFVFLMNVRGLWSQGLHMPVECQKSIHSVSFVKKPCGSSSVGQRAGTEAPRHKCVGYNHCSH